MKFIKKSVFVLVILGAITTYFVTFYIAPNVIVGKHEGTFNINWHSYNFNAEQTSILTNDSITLDSYFVTPKTDSIKGIIIMVHGIGSCKEPFANLAEKLALKQVATVLFDLRAHGKSGGEYCTYGFYEKFDIQKIVSEIKLKYPTTPIGIWGTSLGGAVAIQALELDNRIKFGIIECTFTYLEQIVYDYQKRALFGLGFRPMTNKALKIAGEIANFNPEQVSPINSVKNITQPMFLAHGDKDIHILPKYGKELFQNLASADKEFVLVEGADHNYIHKNGGIEYENKVINFINKQLAP